MLRTATRLRWGSVALLLGLATVLVASSLAPATDVPTALAQFETWADGFGDLRGIAVDADGNVYVTDRQVGTITRIAPDRSRAVLASGLERPIGLALDREGRLFVAEERAARVVRREANGTRTTVVAGIKQPRWLAVHEDGTLFIAARRLTRGTDPEPDDESAEPEIVVALTPAGSLRVFADGFKKLQGLAVGHDHVFAATQGRRDDGRVDGVVFRIPILPGGIAGPALPVGPSDQFKKPVGLARDGLGAVYLTTRELALLDDRSRRAIAKLHGDGHVTVFAENLERPQGLAFDAEGNLYVADGDGGRVLRFQAPARPTLSVAPFTTVATLPITGTTDPGSRVDVFVGDGATPVSVMAGDAGAFGTTVTLVPNSSSVLEVVATAHGGAGLTSAPTEATVVHDAEPPTTGFDAPLAMAHVRHVVGVRVHATDGASEVADLVLAMDQQRLSASLAPAPPAATVTASAAVDTTTLGDGPHTLTATAIDRAGNRITTSRVVIVDNTPPETTITAGPGGSGGTSATFNFVGTDNLTTPAALRFAWRIDGGELSAFSEATTQTLADLAVGAHTFEVVSRDSAGNVDPTPASRTFIVGGLRVGIAEPIAGATVPEGLLLVRGTVEASGAEVGVTVNGVALAVHGTSFVGQVPVTPETTSLAAIATTVTGQTASDSVTMAVVAATDTGMELRASPGGGAVPLRVSFSLLGAPAGTVVLDADDDGIADFIGPTLEGQVFTYAEQGVYVATATVTDASGHQFRARSVVQAFDSLALTAALRARWNEMKDALRVGDVPAALTRIAGAQQARYGRIFQVLGPDLPAIDSILTDLVLDEIRDTEVFFEMARVDAGVSKSFEIRFVIDDDGIWRLWMF